jgi:TorA maturation chaperone TorD
MRTRSEGGAAGGRDGGAAAAGGAVDDCLARSVLYAALATGLGPPTPASVGRLTSAGAARAIRGAARRLDSRRGAGRRLERAAVRAIRALDAAALAARHERLFGHTARGAVPAFETEYGVDGPFRGPQELADLGGYYRAFGLRPRSEPGGRGDHVGCECEFLDFLSRKEAYALEAGDPEMVETTRAAYRSFLRDHLGRFGRALAGRLAAADPAGPYGALAGLLRALIDAEAARVGVPAGPEVLEVRSALADDVPMACGPGAGPACDGCPR